MLTFDSATAPADHGEVSLDAALRPPGRLLSQLEIVLDRLNEGTLVIDDGARVLYANRRAREMLGQVRDLRAPSGRLAFVHGGTQASFQRALAATDDVGGTARPRGFLVYRRDGTTLARAWLEPLQRRRLDTTLSVRLLLSLHALPQHAQVSADMLQSLYGLTASEARVAAQVVSAASVAELAERLHVSPNTVKTHLKRTFRKCEVSSLAQLTALIASGPHGG
jgi:DNA-binding CsgD family transcriptional regulator